MADTKYYFDFNFPLKLVTFLTNLLFGKKDLNTPGPTVDPANREWFSQPRTFAEGGTEVITTTFKLPLSVSELTLEILRMPCVVEVWYQDRSNNWRQVLDMQRIPLRVGVSRSDVKSYFKYHTKCYPIVAKKLQFRLTRTNDPTLEGTPFPLGLRNCLIRRNVYDRSQGSQYFEEEQDILGNIVTKYIKDWDAPKAADDNPYTFWKSAPMPDPAAVASLYLNVRDDQGNPRSIDKVFIDPVYTGQHLNLYYSNDDTVGTRKLNPITINPDEDLNTEWRLGRGRTDISSGLQESYYRWTMHIGPLVEADAWIGVEWTPDFDAADGPPDNPVLLRAMNPDGGSFKPTLEYDVGAGEFTLQFDDGVDTRTYSAPISSAFTAGETLRIVAGWGFTGGEHEYVLIKVVNRRGEVIADYHGHPTTLPRLVSFDGQLELYKFRGTVTALIVKVINNTPGGNHAAGSDGFLASPTYYVDPDPVIPDANGNVPTTTLDNAVYAVSWVTQEHGSGGDHESAYEDKEWTPIWRDYVAERGMLYFPQAISMKYLKLEFTNLTEEPYPIYESGTEVRYKVFPVSVTQQSSAGPRLYTGSGGFLGLGTFISMNGVRSVNWLNPASVLAAIGSVFDTHTPPVTITDGASFISDTLPNNGTELVQSSRRLEAGSSYIYRRDVLQPYILAEDAYVTTIKAEGLQAIAPFTDVPWDDIAAANPGAITRVKSTGTLPVRGTDWWIYPGQQLRVPAAIMEKLTDTSTVTERKMTLERRVRFNTTSIHRYEYRTLKRDAAIAYFAGVREVQPFTSTFIAGEDKPYFDFPTYDPAQFVTNFTRQNEVGATTTLTKLYPIHNRLFERGLENWILDSEDAWSWDGTTGRWLRGTAKCTADGSAHTILSTLQDTSEGEGIDISISVKWEDLEGLDPDDVAIRWGIRTYHDGAMVSEVLLGQIDYTDWDDHLTEDWIDLTENVTIGSGVSGFRVFLQVTAQVQGGSVWFENVKAETDDTTQATIYKSIQTASSFSKVAVDFRDSGLWRGDSMWADINPDSQSIDDTKLAYYTRTIPETIPGGTWGDTTKAWGGSDVEWGSPFGIVSVTVDGDRRYQGRRVLHFRREAGAGEAGIKVKQWTNFVPLALVRIGAVFYKPQANNNEITVRLRRLSDGVIVYEETVAAPSGRWHEFQTRFFEVPTGADQEYEVYLTLDGDDEDELYLSDLYTELALVRYFVRLGGVGSTLHEVTDLRYANGRANVTVTTPVNEFTVQAAILSPKAWAYGCRIQPYYLK